jgi:hypothetical protein
MKKATIIQLSLSRSFGLQACHAMVVLPPLLGLSLSFLPAGKAYATLWYKGIDR